MRMNVYSQELTSDVGMVEKTGTDDKGEQATFKGVRIYLVSPDTLHHTLEDDDRSAITFWLPGSAHRKSDLANALHAMAELVDREAAGD